MAKGGKTGFQDAAGPHYHGHRDRLRERFTDRGPEALMDHELLELLLFRIIPRKDTKPIAKALIERFKTIDAIFAASEYDLRQIKNLGERSAADLKIIHALMTRSLRQRVSDKPLLSSWTAVIDYCKAHIEHSQREQFRVLFLDKKNHLIDDFLMHEGTVDHTPVYPREVMKKALEFNSSAIILVHNHPSGDPTPSRADIDMTKSLVEIGATMNVVIHDHIIIGRDGHASMKGLQLI